MVIATVGGEDIHADEVQHMVQSAMRGKQLPPDMLPIYIPQMVDDIIINRAMGYEATRLGFEVTNDQLRTAIQQMYSAFFPDGRFVGKDQYAAMLAQQGITIDQFEGDLRRQILIARLRDVAVEGTVVTPQEVEQAFKAKYQKIKIQYVKILPKSTRPRSPPPMRNSAVTIRPTSRTIKRPKRKTWSSFRRSSQDRTKHQRSRR